jgi:hypothetical protein
MIAPTASRADYVAEIEPAERGVGRRHEECGLAGYRNPMLSSMMRRLTSG